MATVRFSRLSFETKLSHFNDDTDELDRRKKNLLDVIQYETDINALLEGTDKEFYVGRGNWQFGGVTVEDYVISGRIGKVREIEDQVTDDEKKDFVDVQRESSDIAFFVIHLPTSVMAYVHRRNVGKKAPSRIIEAIFNSYHSPDENLSISPLINKTEVEEELNQLSKIIGFEFVNLRPTNPDSTDRSAPMDEFLGDQNLDKLSLDGEGEDGIKMDHPLLDGGIGLAEEGYGTARITGKAEDGSEKTVSTRENQVREDVDVGSTDETSRRRILQEIRDVLPDDNEEDNQ